MDDARRGRRRLAVGIYMGHHVVADFLFPLPHAFIVDIRDVRFQLRHLFLCDRQSEPAFLPGQRDPEFPPGLVPGIGGEQVQHIVRRVAGCQGGFVTVCHLLFLRFYFTIMLSRSAPTEIYVIGQPMAFSIIST